MCFSVEDATFLLDKFAIVLKELTVLKANTQNYNLAMNNLVEPGHALPCPKAHVGIQGLPSIELMDFPETSSSSPPGASGTDSPPKRKRSPAHSDEGFDECNGEPKKKRKTELVEDVD